MVTSSLPCKMHIHRSQPIRVYWCIHIRYTQRLLRLPFIHKVEDETTLHPINPNPLPAGFTYTRVYTVLGRHVRRRRCCSPPMRSHMEPPNPLPTLPTSDTNSFSLTDFLARSDKLSQLCHFVLLTDRNSKRCPHFSKFIKHWDYCKSIKENQSWSYNYF